MPISNTDLITQVEEAIEAARRGASNLGPWELDGVPRLSSHANLHFLNNVGAISTAFLELGTYQGSSLVAASTGNDHLRAVGIDGFGHNFEIVDGRKVRHRDVNVWRGRLLGNMGRIRGRATVRFFEEDHWSCDHGLVAPYGPFDFYYYDGSHHFRSQLRAMSAWLDVMADRYIFVSDDYDLEKIRRATQRGIKYHGLHVIHDWYLGEDHPQYDVENEWGTGFYVAILEKP